MAGLRTARGHCALSNSRLRVLFVSGARRLVYVLLGRTQLPVNDAYRIGNERGFIAFRVRRVIIGRELCCVRKASLCFSDESNKWIEGTKKKHNCRTDPETIMFPSAIKSQEVG